MSERLIEAGLYIDDLNKLRIVDPNVTQDTVELKEECENYLSKVADFQQIVHELIRMMEDVARTVEKQKLKAIVTRSQLVSIGRLRKQERKQLDVKIQREKDENERLETLIRTLQKEEADQMEFIERFLMGR